MSEARIRDFEEFWPFYLGEHAKPATRWLHWAGTNMGVGVAVGAVVTGQLWAIPLALVPGYAFAWFSHFVIEKNKPASFSYPLWSFMADWKMWALMWTGQLGPHLRSLSLERSTASQ